MFASIFWTRYDADLTEILPCLAMLFPGELQVGKCDRGSLLMRTISFRVAEPASTLKYAITFAFQPNQITNRAALDFILHFDKTYVPRVIIDYSDFNAKAYEAKVRAAVVVARPFYRATDVDALRKLVAQTEKEYDLFFCGSLSVRRCAVFEALRHAGVAVHVVQHKGQKRDREAAKCKALLNIHAGPDYQVREALRIDRFVYAGMPVVTEKSIDDSSPEYLEERMIRAISVHEYESLAAMTKSALEESIIACQVLSREEALEICAARHARAQFDLNTVFHPSMFPTSDAELPPPPATVRSA